MSTDTPMQPTALQTKMQAFEARQDLYIAAKFAPGDYSCRCISCGRKFSGDKRAARCFKCATALIDNRGGDTPTAERDVVAAIAALLLGRVNAPEPEIYRASRDIVTLARTMERAEITRLRAELEQAREALLYAKICMEAQQEISQPELGGFAYPDSPLGRVRAALCSSPGESAPKSSETDHG